MMLRPGGLPILAGIAWLLLSAAANAGELAGLWQQTDEDSGQPSALIRISAGADGTFEGVVERYYPAPGEPESPLCVHCPAKLHNSPIVGMKILDGLKRKDEYLFEGGQILDPEEGKTYRCRMRLAPDGKTVKVTGYIGISLLGRSESWTRQE
ncbi:MAG TPA: DUF2147 domain-containing protein [Methylophilaceae bacterium]|nr:DUF2147 domain-containing protein [Methylophilaceae bacterium]